MELQQRILYYMKNNASGPVSDETIAEALKLTNEELIELFSALDDLEKQGLIVCNRNDLYGLPSQMNLVAGKLSMNSKGYGFVIPQDNKEAQHGDIFIPAATLNSAMNNDIVIARVSNSDLEKRSREGEIIRVLHRANKQIVGTFEKNTSFGFVTPDDSKITQDIFIHKRNFNKAAIGTKVIVEITRWPKKRQNPEGKIIKVLGKANDPGIDVLSVIHQYELPMDFPIEVQKAAKKIPMSIMSNEYTERTDRRNLPIVTIDGDDAKDLDDGVYAQKVNGHFLLGVYIADVSHYVRENSAIDLEARKRGTSVYLVDRVIPMLPTCLSNGICSLNAGEDRLSMAAEMEINSNGDVISYNIFPTIIHVHKRLTYNTVNKILVNKDQETIQNNRDILELLDNLKQLRKILKERRIKHGSIDFNIPEIKVKLDSKGYPIALLKREGSLGESIIEECMLIANETVAQHMAKKKTPFIYRVHEQPDSEKISTLNNLLATFNLHINKNTKTNTIDPLSIQKVLHSVKGLPEEKIISSVALRTMQQARYSEENLGHFGLAAQFYTHFTSPIRRYPDLIVHRLLSAILPTGKISITRQEQLKKILPGIALSSSIRERIAADAERDTIDMKKIEYMAQFIGNEFDAVISGVTSFGIFVELDNGVEGLVHVSSMANDYYEYIEEQYALVGRHTNTLYQIGGSVTVILMRADIKERILDFVLKDNGVYNDFVHNTPVLSHDKKPVKARIKTNKHPVHTKKNKPFPQNTSLVATKFSHNPAPKEKHHNKKRKVKMHK
ncbi:ribonuclease R [Pectinatus sottacetonis]|uniref:ribonuclease R n=1 Tax=Pectinatus sottacetonis TaxID=1002795 RepID=UPI0018C68FAA|nr:ribonuclease R [Pectinatus sottacetonis]